MGGVHVLDAEVHGDLEGRSIGETLESFHGPCAFSAPVSSAANYDLATRIVRQHQERARREAIEDGPAVGSQYFAEPDRREGPEKPDFLRTDGPDRRVHPVSGRIHSDAVKLAELEYGCEFVQAGLRGFHPGVGYRHINAGGERQESEAQDGDALSSGTDAGKTGRLQQGNGTGHCADQAQVEE